jgi:metal-dependent HD superfamily phosphatase/phosphodiesterase
MLTYQDISRDPQIRAYIELADKTMRAMGYTEHSFAHTERTAKIAHDLLLELDYSPRTAELGRIAGFMHDIGNVINRADHAHSGALMAFRLLSDLGLPADEVGIVVSAIGHHDEGSAFPVNAPAAALILADKSDVRRSRVRNPEISTFDIHDRVNYAVIKSWMSIDKVDKSVLLELTVDTEICSVMDYFEIFLNRMLLCRKAAQFFDLDFKLTVNHAQLT